MNSLSAESSSSRALRVLLVEDVEHDAEFVEHHLREGGLECDSRRVETESEMRETIREFQPEIILSDFSLPRFDGYGALQVAREMTPDVPFIFVSGTLGEERAIAALHRGASDYILKHNLRRLVPAVNRALERAESLVDRRRQEEQLARTTRTLRLLSGINTLIVRVEDRTELFEEACRLTVAIGDYSSAIVMLKNPATAALEAVACAGRDMRLTNQLRAALSSGSTQEGGPVSRVLNTGQPYVCNALIDPAATARITSLMKAAGFESTVSLPLIVDKTVVGVLLLTAARAWAVSDEELRTLREIAANLSFALQYLQKHMAVQMLSHFDARTGLAKRALVSERLTRRLNQSSPGRGLGVGVLDLEQLSVINYSFGRHAGDLLLEHVADRLRQRIGNTELLAQLGGGTFAIVLDVAPGEDLPAVLAAHLDALFQQPFVIDGRTIPVLARSGLAVYPTDGVDASSLLENAELALREAKESGTRHRLYSAAHTTAVVARLALEHKLRKALRQQQFELHYQPKISARDQRIAGAEALIRWRDPDTGLVPPAVFLPVLESSGLIEEVGEWIVEQAVTDTEYLRLEVPDFRVAVNVSPLQFRRADFSERFLRLMRAATTTGMIIDMEITEGMLGSDAHAEIRKLQTLRAAGVRIAIDDFGTGYSSLSRLAELPIDTLKIDRSFVSRLPRDAQGRTLVATVIRLAQAFEMTTIAEGVETREQLAVLRDMQCDELQGYLISRPMPCAALVAWLRSRRGGAVTSATG